MSYYIYKICCDDLPEFVYVGSTKAFRQRKNEHKSNCNNDNKKHNFKLYQTIRENGGWENWRMVIIDECG
jgi:predicted GIY-YIG superfamily endonuclease